MPEPFAQRQKAVVQELKRRELDCLLVTHPANWYYLTGFTGESGALVVSREGTTLVTDGRFTVQAQEETRGVKIELQKGALFAATGDYLKKGGHPGRRSLGRRPQADEAGSARKRNRRGDRIPDEEARGQRPLV